MSSADSFRRLCAIAGCLSIGLLGACSTSQGPATPAPPPEPPPAPHQLTADQPDFLRLPNIVPQNTPVRVGVILPFNDNSAGVRALAKAMMQAAELALYDSANPNIVLMTAEDGGTPADAAAAAQKLLDEGAEVIIGPIFSASVAAVAPLTRDHGVPVLAFSTDRSVAGNGVYLLSFQPQSEVRRVLTYAAGEGRQKICAMVPQNPYGELVEQTIQEIAPTVGASVTSVERFSPNTGAVTEPAAAIAKADCQAIFIPTSGSLLRGVVQTFAYNNVDNAKVRYLGTGLWNEPSTLKEALLNGGWFAAPDPSTDAAFRTKYRQTFGGEPPQIAALAYDAVSLVALLAGGTPYHRFTLRTLTDPNGFAGVDGIFRFRPDGSLERGLAVLTVEPGGFRVVSPAPTTFQAAVPGS